MLTSSIHSNNQRIMLLQSKSQTEVTKEKDAGPMNAEQQQKLLQEAAAAAAAAAAASRPSTTTTTAAASNPYLAALAAANNPAANASAYLRPPLLPGVAPGALPPSTTSDNSWLMSPLLQAAMRQQQLQWISQIASLSAQANSPFMNQLAMASLGGSLPGAAAAAAAAAAASGQIPPLIPTTSATSESKSDVTSDHKSSAATMASLASALASSTSTTTTPSATSSSVIPGVSGLDSVYREYLSKIVENEPKGTVAASEAAEVMANLFKKAAAASSTTSGNDTNGNSKSSKDLGHVPVSTPPVVSPPAGIGAAQPRMRINNGRSSSDYTGKDKVFTCKTCNRSFGYKHVLQNHERTHTGEKPFECKVCHKRFTRDHHLKTHMRLHTGEKPYSCTHCDRQFVQVANLRRHLRVHTGERPYKCEVCTSTFSDSNQLKAHILIHKGEKPFSCEKCGGKFRRRHHLMHHVCPMVPGSSQIAVDPSDNDDPDDDERFIMAAKRARSASMKEGMYEDTPPTMLHGLGGQNLELSLLMARARAAAAQEEVLRQMTGAAQVSAEAPSTPPAIAGVLAGGNGSAQGGRSRKSRDPKRLQTNLEDDPQSEPEDLSSSNKKNSEDVNLDLLAITTSEVQMQAAAPSTATPTLSQMPIANK